MQNIQTGSFMHEIIDTFFEVLEEKDLDIRNLDEETLKKIVEEIIESYFEMSKYYIFSSTAKFTKKIKKSSFRINRIYSIYYKK